MPCHNCRFSPLPKLPLSLKYLYGSMHHLYDIVCCLTPTGVLRYPPLYLGRLALQKLNEREQAAHRAAQETLLAEQLAKLRDDKIRDEKER